MSNIVNTNKISKVNSSSSYYTIEPQALYDTTSGSQGSLWHTQHIPGHQHTIGGNTPVTPSPFGPVQGLDELCQLLGVNPVEGPHNGLLLTSVSGQVFSLIDLLNGQLSLMTRLHVLLVHRPPIPETGE